MTEGSRALWEQRGRAEAHTARRATWRRSPETNPKETVRVFQKRKPSTKIRGQEGAAREV